MNCKHNHMVENKGDPSHAWKCADCGYVYSAGTQEVNRPARKMQALIDSFPCLKMRGLKWGDQADCKQFKKWLKVGLSSGEYDAVCFVLMVWDHFTYAKKFQLAHAVSNWSQDNREPFARWVANPWFM